MKLVRYENIQKVIRQYLWMDNLYTATAVYENGKMEKVTLSEFQVKRYEFDQKLNSILRQPCQLGGELVTIEELTNDLDYLLDLRYEQGRSDEREISYE